jgi:hypothetical protein
MEMCKCELCETPAYHSVIIIHHLDLQTSATYVAGTFIISIYAGLIWGLDRLNNFLKITKLRNQADVLWLHDLCSESLNYNAYVVQCVKLLPAPQNGTLEGVWNWPPSMMSLYLALLFRIVLLLGIDKTHTICLHMYLAHCRHSTMTNLNTALGNDLNSSYHLSKLTPYKIFKLFAAKNNSKKLWPSFFNWDFAKITWISVQIYMANSINCPFPSCLSKEIGSLGQLVQSIKQWLQCRNILSGAFLILLINHLHALLIYKPSLFSRPACLDSTQTGPAHRMLAGRPLLERSGQWDGRHHSLGVPLLRFLARMDGLRGEMLEARQEPVRGGVLFLHAELRRKEKGKKRKRSK